MATQMIRADGVDWPVDSFIDNYRMLRIEGAYPDFDGRDPLCDVLTTQGEYRTRLRASVVDWGRVRAFASQDLPGGGKCEFCGRDDVTRRATAQLRLVLSLRRL